MSGPNDGAVVVLVPPVELDIASADLFATELADALRRRPVSLELDWTTVRFCDSTGMRVLIDAAELARAVGCRLEFRNPSRPLLRLTHMLGVSALFGLPLPPPLPGPSPHA